ncbi:MAG: hypothetical protein JO360_09545 [Acidobacteria bacterium]|nr:hypothetical protein [Acidobacteriota bacterium]
MKTQTKESRAKALVTQRKDSSSSLRHQRLCVKLFLKLTRYQSIKLLWKAFEVMTTLDTTQKLPLHLTEDGTIRNIKRPSNCAEGAKG